MPKVLFWQSEEVGEEEKKKLLTWDDKCKAEVEMAATWFDMERRVCPS